MPRIPKKNKVKKRKDRSRKVSQTILPDGGVRFSWRSFILTDLWFTWLPLFGALFMSIPWWFPETHSGEGEPPSDEVYVWLFSIAFLMNLLGWVNRRQVVEIKSDSVRLSRGLIPNIWGYQRISIPRGNVMAVETGRDLAAGGGPDDTAGGVDTPTHLQTCYLLIQDRPDHYYRFIGELPRHQWNPIMEALRPPTAAQKNEERVAEMKWSRAFSKLSKAPLNISTDSSHRTSFSQSLSSLDEEHRWNRGFLFGVPVVVIVILLSVFKPFHEPDPPKSPEKVEKTTSQQKHRREKITPRCGLGEPDELLNDVSAHEWHKYTCKGKKGQSVLAWRQCLRWQKYTTDRKEACRGKKRCCPPSL